MTINAWFGLLLAFLAGAGTLAVAERILDRRRPPVSPITRAAEAISDALGPLVRITSTGRHAAADELAGELVDELGGIADELDDIADGLNPAVPPVYARPYVDHDSRGAAAWHGPSGSGTDDLSWLAATPPPA